MSNSGEAINPTTRSRFGGFLDTRSRLAIIIVLGVVGLTITFWRLSRFRKTCDILGGPEVVAMINSAEKVEVFQTLASYALATNSWPEPPQDPTSSVGEGTVLPPLAAQKIKKMLLTPRSYLQDMKVQRGGAFSPEVVLKFRKSNDELEFVVCVESGLALLKVHGLNKTLDIEPIRTELAAVMKPHLSRQPASWPPQ
jgi:hypothetical protein